jgi:hypothetical protein
MLGVEAGQFKHYATEFQRHLYEQRQVGPVGRWWHDTHVRYLVSWRSRSSREAGVDG